MKCNLSTINGWCGIFNKPCKECISPTCKFIKKAYRQGRVEAEYFTCYKNDWIPVGEGLPEGRTDVLVYSDVGHIIGYYDDVIGLWYGLRPFIDNIEVIAYAWQPMPEPYGGGDTECTR